jgi:hypothetical protein
VAVVCRRRKPRRAGAFGFWWIDSAGSLAIVWLLVKEGREAWTGDCCDCA